MGQAAGHDTMGDKPWSQSTQLFPLNASYSHSSIKTNNVQTYCWFLYVNLEVNLSWIIQLKLAPKQNDWMIDWVSHCFGLRKATWDKAQKHIRQNMLYNVVAWVNQQATGPWSVTWSQLRDLIWHRKVNYHVWWMVQAYEMKAITPH